MEIDSYPRQVGLRGGRVQLFDQFLDAGDFGSGWTRTRKARYCSRAPSDPPSCWVTIARFRRDAGSLESTRTAWTNRAWAFTLRRADRESPRLLRMAGSPGTPATRRSTHARPVRTVRNPAKASPSSCQATSVGPVRFHCEVGPEFPFRLAPVALFELQCAEVEMGVKEIAVVVQGVEIGLLRSVVRPAAR